MLTNKPKENHKVKISERLNQILNDPSASYWLKDALRSALKRDIVDAANDAQVLAEVLADRCSDLTCPKGWDQVEGGAQ